MDSPPPVETTLLHLFPFCDGKRLPRPLLLQSLPSLQLPREVLFLLSGILTTKYSIPMGEPTKPLDSAMVSHEYILNHGPVGGTHPLHAADTQVLCLHAL